MRKVSERRVYVLRDENRFRLSPEFVRRYVGKQPAWGYGLLSYVTYKRTYARRVTQAQFEAESLRYFGVPLAGGSTQTSEEFWQTCVRVVEGVSSIIKQHVRDTGQTWSDDEEQHHAQEMFRRIWAFKFTPPGRGLWGMGTEALELKGSAILNNCGFESTEFLAADFADPFCTLMDYSMLGVGMGFDILGAGTITLQEPFHGVNKHTIPDTREGWIDAVRITLNAFVGKGELPGGWDFSKIRREGKPLKTFGGTASGPGPLKKLLAEVERLCRAEIGRPVSSTFIVDVMNVIGVCVVAGNVRRSSEIAIADAEDKEFQTLKDNTRLLCWLEEQDAIAKADPKWARLQRQITKIETDRAAANVGVLDPAYAGYQTAIDKRKASQKRRLKNLEAWVFVNRQVQEHPLMTHRWASNNTVVCKVGRTNYTPLVENTIRNGEPGYAWPEIFQAYGRLADPPNFKDKKAKGFNPCGEQTLHARELCCLVELYPTKHTDLDDFLATIKYAYRYAKAVTLVPTHNQKTNAVMVRNRRIGTSMAGVAELYSKLGLAECVRWWDAGYKAICEWDAEYSGWLGVNESIKKTSIKPGGTTPLLVGVEGGLKLPTSAFYMRTIRLDHTSPLVAALREAGYRVEPDRTTPRTTVAYFPCKAPDGARLAADTTLWEQAAVFTALQRYWSDNMVSATLTFQPHEAQDITRVLQAHEGQWKCVSFLPLSTHGYLQAPYIPCTQEQYDQARAQLKPLSFDGLLVNHDSEDKFCSGGICEIPVAKD